MSGMRAVNICVIGAGNIGFRHWQSLLDIEFPANLFLVDPEPAALGRAEIECAAKAKHAWEIRYCNSIARLPETIDLAIIATNSDVRAAVTVELINTRKVRYMIFEKVLFQAQHEYSDIFHLIQEGDIKAWTNCPRRLYPYYAELKEELEVSSQPISYAVVGGEWGLACNAIHFIDHMEWLTGERVMDVHTAFLEDKVRASKRAGFIELCGTLSCQFERGSRLLLHSSAGGDKKFQVHIMQGRSTWSYDEFSNIRVTKVEGEYSCDHITPPFQSTLTRPVAERIFIEGDCDLVDYCNSMRQHLALIDALTLYVKRFDPSISAGARLPVT